MWLTCHIYVEALYYICEGFFPVPFILVIFQKTPYFGSPISVFISIYNYFYLFVHFFILCNFSEVTFPYHHQSLLCINGFNYIINPSCVLFFSVVFFCAYLILKIKYHPNALLTHVSACFIELVFSTFLESTDKCYLILCDIFQFPKIVSHF